MDIHFFFKNGREEAASAYLATLLEQDASFRTGFTTLVGSAGVPSPSGEPNVSVEHPLGAGFIDVVVEYDKSVILVENKVNSGAKRDGQLAGYYTAAMDHWGSKRLVAVYLAPDVALGWSEVAEVERLIADARRGGTGGDIAVAIDWSSVLTLTERVSATHASFARGGAVAILAAIEAAKRGPGNIEWTKDEFLRAIQEDRPSEYYVAAALLGWMEATGAELLFGRGRTGPLLLTVAAPGGRTQTIGRVGMDGWVKIDYNLLREVPPFDDTSMLAELVSRLNAVPGLASKRIPDDYFEQSGGSWLRPAPESMQPLIEVLDWLRDSVTS
jgi:hypothetical protein